MDDEGLGKRKVKCDSLLPHRKKQHDHKMAIRMWRSFPMMGFHDKHRPRKPCQRGAEADSVPIRRGIGCVIVDKKQVLGSGKCSMTSQAEAQTALDAAPPPLKNDLPPARN